jgi:hypothetical protein
MLAIQGMIVLKPVKKLLSSTTGFTNNKEAIRVEQPIASTIPWR